MSAAEIRRTTGSTLPEIDIGISFQILFEAIGHRRCGARVDLCQLLSVVPAKRAKRAQSRDHKPQAAVGAKKAVTTSSRNNAGLWLWAPAFAGGDGCI